MSSRVIRDMTNEEYHGDPNSFSSSNMKDAIDDIEILYKSKILKKGVKESKPAYDTGTYFHALVLEPENLWDQCAIYDKVRRGKEWEDFKALHPNKAIVKESQRLTAEKIAQLVFDSPRAMELIKLGEAEVSVFVDLKIDWEAGVIYSADLSQRLTDTGWEFIEFDEEIQLSLSTVNLTVKVRADSLIVEQGAILDLKSTTGNAKNSFKVRRKISDFNYDLSASMYLDVFSLAYNKPFDKFYWTFASKDKDNCKTYVASPTNIRVGRAKWTKGAFLIAEYMHKGWEFEDTVETLEPEPYQMEWIKKED